MRDDHISYHQVDNIYTTCTMILFLIIHSESYAFLILQFIEASVSFVYKLFEIYLVKTIHDYLLCY